jgi:hypothetical protein
MRHDGLAPRLRIWIVFGDAASRIRTARGWQRAAVEFNKTLQSALTTIKNVAIVVGGHTPAKTLSRWASRLMQTKSGPNRSGRSIRLP